MEKSGEMVRVIYSQNGIWIYIFLPFTVRSHPSSAKYVEAPKIGSTTRGIPARSGPWLAAPFSFGIAHPTMDMGLVSQFLCVCGKDLYFCF